MKFSPLIFLAALSSSLSAIVAAGNFETPQPYDTLYAGLSTTVTYDGSHYTDNDTVAIFFDEDRSHLLGYGPAKQGQFTFVVPESAVTPEDRNSSHLLAVFRRNLYLWDVDNVPVKIIMPPPTNVTSSEQQQQDDGTTSSPAAVNETSTPIEIQQQDQEQEGPASIISNDDFV
ncbi:hypothetical protein BDA99DRAFT_505545 [Phascolomyces articulosus]|uniref:Uncharacterized protein n=1 Tax=Phascolomyces articulosus TaxID=60185 RepID=A0AAD5K4F5_9FUNG|nr:hypothetical protein BDA99DRAFT_505545 [Phascolomyces articulosus]